jgi:hypothetical protein
MFTYRCIKKFFFSISQERQYFCLKLAHTKTNHPYGYPVNAPNPHVFKVYFSFEKADPANSLKSIQHSPANQNFSNSAQLLTHLIIDFHRNPANLGNYPIYLSTKLRKTYSISHLPSILSHNLHIFPTKLIHI